jgi:hypothetical protein
MKRGDAPGRARGRCAGDYRPRPTRRAFDWETRQLPSPKPRPRARNLRRSRRPEAIARTRGIAGLCPGFEGRGRTTETGGAPVRGRSRNDSPCAGLAAGRMASDHTRVGAGAAGDSDAPKISLTPLDRREPRFNRPGRVIVQAAPTIDPLCAERKGGRTCFPSLSSRQAVADLALALDENQAFVGSRRLRRGSCIRG